MTAYPSDFERSGIVFPIPVLDAGELHALQDEYAKLVAIHGDTLTRVDRLHLFFGWAWDLAAHPRVVDAVVPLLGDDVIVWGTLLLCKPPYDDEFVAWHQDGAYAEYLAGTPAVSAWIALTDSTAANGCMRVIPGSHRTRFDHVQRHRPHNMLSRGQEIGVDVDEAEAVDVELRAGEMSLHHVDLVHGSKANESASWRMGFIVRYATPAVAGAPATITVARGRGPSHLQTLRNRPAAPLREALAAHHAAQP